MEGDFAQDCFYHHLLQNPLCHKLELISVFAGPPVQLGALKSLESQARYIARPAMAMDAPRRRLGSCPRNTSHLGPLINEIFEVDPLLWSCGAQLRIISVITQPRIVGRILRHLRSERCQARDPFESRAPPRSASLSRQ